MGGNALKVAPTARLMAKDYHVLARDLVESLVREFGGRAQESSSQSLEPAGPKSGLTTGGGV